MRPSAGSGVEAVTPASSSALRVHPGAVAIPARKEGRAVGDDPVELLPSRRPALERRHVPATAADPCLVRVRPRIRLDHIDLGTPRLRIGVELAPQHRQPAMDRMDVCVLEPGRHGAPAKLDHAGARSDRSADRRVRADGHDPSVAYRRARCPRPGGVHGRDPATTEDEVGGLVSLASVEGAGGRGVAVRPSTASRPARRRSIAGHDIGPPAPRWVHRRAHGVIHRPSCATVMR